MRDFTVGNLIKSYRTRLGLKQEEVANPDDPELLPFTLRTYQGWENGERIPSNERLRRIASFFRLTDAEADELYRAAAQVAPEIHNLPFHPNPYFTGREKYLELLDQHFKQNRPVAVTQPLSMSGLGGIGKTQLALAYAHRSYRTVYRTVLWVDAASQATLEISYLALARLLQLPEKNEREVDHIVQAVKKWLEDHSNLGIVAERIEVDVMEREEGVSFLLRRSKSGTEMEAPSSSVREAATRLVELLGEHPLALDQAGAYIEEAGISFDNYIQKYHQQRSVLLNQYGPLGTKHPEHPQTVVITFEISLQGARELCPVASDVLHFCSFLHPDDIPEELLSQEESLKLSATALDEAIAALRRYSLIRRKAVKQFLSVHRLVQAVLQDHLSEQEREIWMERVILTLMRGFPVEVGFDRNPMVWDQCERLIPHVLACATHMQSWKNSPLVLILASLLYQSAAYLEQRAQYGEAESLCRQALHIWEQTLGPEDLGTANTLLGLGNIYQSQGKYREAEPLYQRALHIYEEQTLNPEYPADTAIFLLNLAICLYNLANLYKEQGKYREAEPLYRRALHIREQTLGSEHPDVATLLNNLAGLYGAQSQYAEAEQFHRRALHIREQTLGSEHPNVAFSLHHLAATCLEQRKYGEAEQLCLRALNIYEQIYGPSDKTTSQTRILYATIRISSLSKEKYEP